MAECVVCDNMIEQMCKASDDKKACKENLNKLEETNVFESMVKSEVFNEDFRENVKKGVMGDEYEKPESNQGSFVSDMKSIGRMKPLSIRQAVKDSYNIIRGKT